ncbi:MAG: methyltransferase [Alphaproteobacteria bacterium]|nr:methyltransferase [Alphaproteobacteria bacterium]
MDLGPDTETTADGFLGKRLVALQPKKGFRAGSDTLFLAAAVPAAPGERVLELGIGAGVASLALAARVEGLAITGLEIEPVLGRLAEANFSRNRSAGAVSGTLEVIVGDVAVPPPGLGAGGFDHVFLNPPFFQSEAASAPADAARATARHAPRGSLEAWIRLAAAAVRPGGSLTLIARAAALPDLMRPMGAGPGAAGELGGLVLFPLWPGNGRPAKTALLQAWRGSATPLRLSAGLALHDAAGAFTPAADAVLREAAGIDLGAE